MWESADAERVSRVNLGHEREEKTKSQPTTKPLTSNLYAEQDEGSFFGNFSTKGDFFYYNLMLIRTPKSFPVCGRRQVTCPLLNVRCSIETLAGPKIATWSSFRQTRILPRRIFFIIKNLKEKRSTKREMIKRKRKTTKGGEAKKWYTLKYFIGLLASADYFNSNYFWWKQKNFSGERHRPRNTKELFHN